ncbi:carbohydrate ABC transporter permease [Halobacteria archaeon AArc-m2/3/4]|uniref:Carbohydrate ABC transporter permease n=1 Tax=Natronoglomus mannanivorans TaxID=2979990 RepID=A0AAP3E2Z3_9EURY|nr:carbohydrate ABC transporter permease [Halobacteria archaeon AArc-xg1-1]MCU4973424.1 carbohydrate ABC transporter permease [Halobacteria archaeon AArc-m2/3/4]
MSTKSFLNDIRNGETFENQDARNLFFRKIALYAGLYGAALLFIIPYLWMISRGFQPRWQLFAAEPYLIPREITFQWYSFLFEGTPIIRWTINTIIIAGGATLAVLLVDSMIAYSLTRLNWPGKRVVFSVIVASFMVPGIVNLIPVYQIIVELGLLNSYLGVMLPVIAGPIGVFMLVQFFKDFPDEIEESARIDGFSTFQIYTRLILPMMKSALTALGLFIFIWTWNAFLWPLILLQEESMYTLPIGLVVLQDTMTAQQPGLIMASALFASLPLFIVFLLLQKQLVEAVQMQGTVG